MPIGTYKTTDPNVRIRVVFDEDYPTENPAFPYAEGVLEALQKCHFEGDYYGVIVETRHKWQNMETGEIREDWEDHDSIWSCAGYGDNVAEEVAKEYFGITVTGRE